MNAVAVSRTPAVLAVDGGNSKTDVALVAADGTLLALLTGPTVSHQAVGLDQGMATLRSLVTGGASKAAVEDRRPIARVAVLCLAGADSPRDIRRLTHAVGALELAEAVDVRNDTEAPLRAGTEGWGVAVVCGTGINAIGRAPDGRTARFAGLGQLSGDFAGGGAAGVLALGAAAAAQEGRARRTSLERAVPDFFGLRRPLDVTFAIEHGRLSRTRLRDLAPIVFREAVGGDAAARGIVDHIADEIVSFATAAILRLHLTRAGVPVVLSGGLFQAIDQRFHGRIVAGIGGVAPSAVVSVLRDRPVLGAALLGLDTIGSPDEARERTRAAFAGIRARDA